MFHCFALRPPPLLESSSSPLGFEKAIRKLPVEIRELIWREYRDEYHRRIKEWKLESSLNWGGITYFTWRFDTRQREQSFAVDIPYVCHAVLDAFVFCNCDHSGGMYSMPTGNQPRLSITVERDCHCKRFYGFVKTVFLSERIFF